MKFHFKNKWVCFVILALSFAGMPGQLLRAQDVTGESGSLAWQVEHFYKYRSDGKPGRAVSLRLKQPLYQVHASVRVTCNSVTEITQLGKTDTLSRLSILLPSGAGVDAATTASITVAAGGKEISATVFIPVKKQWTVYIYPHSHVDIGYTGLQEDVEKIHVRNVDVGIDLAMKTKDYPEGARFVWNTEATWVVDAYLRKTTAEQKRKLIDAVKKGWVQIDAGHSNVNTTTCSDEELMRFFKNSNEIEKLTGVKVSTMVEMDSPGAAWGLVQVAAQNGVNGFISFPNNYDLRKIREHQPFYWRGPDGKSRMLFLQAFPYGIGYTTKGSKYGLETLQTYSDKYDRVSTVDPMKNFIAPFIFEETAKLEWAKSPFDLFVMAWSMADNCVIDADLPEAVRQWNATYAYPKLVIAGTKDILTAWEKKYGSIIPEESGDFTEFWTDGLGSGALHVGEGRCAKEKLVQAETIWTLLNPRNFPQQQINNAWENILLSAEHTWGYQNPGAPLAKVIEQRKAAFFTMAERQSDSLIQSLQDPSATGKRIAVVNTLCWDRASIVTLSAAQSKWGDRVIDLSTGREVPSQRLSTGELIFQSNTIPALASRLYEVKDGTFSKKTSLTVSSTSLKNEFLNVSLETQHGTISNVVDLKSHYDFVVPEKGLNAYYHLPGVYNGSDSIGKPSGVDSVTISLKEKGPLLVSLVVRSKAPGTNWLEREVKLYANQRFIQVCNTFDKIRTRRKEGIHFGFNFNLPDPVSHMDAPWSVIIPEVNQLKGANRNWMTFQRWIDISGIDKGVTWTAIESPLVEWGEMSGNVLDGGREYRRWKKKLEPSSTLYSWPLNNHWNTNFPLEQGGIQRQQYAVLFHEKYDVVVANRFGMEQHRPLLVIPAEKNPIDRSFVSISNPKVIVSNLGVAEDKKGIVLRLRSFSPEKERVRLGWPDDRPQVIRRCNAEEVPFETVKNEFDMLPYGTETLYLAF